MATVSKTTPKIATYFSVLYYFKQNYMNWKYYVDDRRRDYVYIQEGASYALNKDRVRIDDIEKLTLLNVSTDQYITLDSFTSGEAITDVIIESSLTQDINIQKILIFDQYGNAIDEINDSIIVNSATNYFLFSKK